MSRSLIRYSVPFMSSALVALAVFACSSSKSDNTGGGTGGSVPEGGVNGGANNGGGGANGGHANGGGGVANGGGGVANNTGGAAEIDASADYVCQSRAPLDPVGTLAKDAKCCPTEIGEVGTCVEESSITDPLLKTSYGHSLCATGLKCAPAAAAVADAGAFGVYDPCTSTIVPGGLEGRCLPRCFVAGNPQAPNLKQDGCMGADGGKNSEMVCAPCYNPLDGSKTGACSQKAGDAPTTQPPTPFKTCGAVDGGSPGGTCVPEALVLASGNPAAPSLKQDDCSTGEKCVPTLKANDINACFAKCTTSSTLSGVDPKYGPGACVPTFVVRDVAGVSGLQLLEKGTCGDGELCAPCLDPLNGGAPSHSCE